MNWILLVKRRSEPVRHLLVDDSEIHEAALWRLADWMPEEVEQATTALLGLLERGVALDSTQPDVAMLLHGMGRADRRDPWTALCALLVFLAEGTGDKVLYWRAGIGVLDAHRQAMRRSQSRSDDALDQLLRDYLRLRPETSARDLFAHCKGLAPFRVVIVDEEEGSLTYLQHKDSRQDKTIRWHAFEQRVSRLRQQMKQELADPKNELYRVWQQPVAVSSGA